MLRLLHTSDWHLGHQLHGTDRRKEHRVFLDFLMTQLGEHAVDVLLITGDIFDSANPPTSALATWYGFLGQARRSFPELDIVVIAGNHDSGPRLDAPRDLLNELRIHVVGNVRWRQGQVDGDAMVIPVHDAQGDRAGVIAAVPYIRMSDLVRTPDDADRVAHGVGHVYHQVFQSARAQRGAHQALIATGHLTTQGAVMSGDSERPILAGESALPTHLFGTDLSYLALGHLHLAQDVDAPCPARYAGAPLPLSISEAAYPHQIALCVFDGGTLTEVQPLLVPKPRQLLRFGPANIEEILSELESIVVPTGALTPLVQVTVRSHASSSEVRHQLQAAARNRPFKLTRIALDREGLDPRPLAEQLPVEDLRELDVEDVFVRRYQRSHPDAPPDDLMLSFRQLVEEVHQDQVPKQAVGGRH